MPRGRERRIGPDARKRDQAGASALPGSLGWDCNSVMAELIQGHNGRVPSTFCPKLGLVVGAPHTDAAQFPYRAPHTHEMSCGRQFPGAYGLPARIRSTSAGSVPSGTVVGGMIAAPSAKPRPSTLCGRGRPTRLDAARWVVPIAEGQNRTTGAQRQPGTPQNALVGGGCRPWTTSPRMAVTTARSNIRTSATCCIAS